MHEMGKIHTGPCYTESSELFLRDQQQRQAAWVLVRASQHRCVTDVAQPEEALEPSSTQLLRRPCHQTV